MFYFFKVCVLCVCSVFCLSCWSYVLPNYVLAYFVFYYWLCYVFRCLMLRRLVTVLWFKNSQTQGAGHLRAKFQGWPSLARWKFQGHSVFTKGPGVCRCLAQGIDTWFYAYRHICTDIANLTYIWAYMERLGIYCVQPRTHLTPVW